MHRRRARGKANAHHCHARGCDVAVPPEMLMCRPHWRMVPTAMKRAVWDAYVPGQCDLDPMPSEAWHAAAQDAIDFVAVREAHDAR